MIKHSNITNQTDVGNDKMAVSYFNVIAKITLLQHIIIHMNICK